MAENSVAKCGITFICKDLSTAEYAHCAVLMNYFVSVGYRVSLITDERPNGNEFRYDSTINHMSVDTPVRFVRERKAAIADFAKNCNSSLFVLFTSSVNMCTDAQVLIDSGYKVLVIENVPVLSLLASGEAPRYKRYLDTLSKVSAVISLSHSAYAHLNGCSLQNVVYSPYLVPFTFGEIHGNDEPDSIVLLFRDKTIDKNRIAKIFDYVKNECPDEEIIVHGLDGADYPADERITFTQEAYIEFISRFKKAMIFTSVPSVGDVAISLTARQIPFAFFSAFNDPSLNAVTTDKIYIPDEIIKFTLDDQKALCEKLESLIEKVISNGKTDGVFDVPEYFDDAYSAYLKELSSKYNLTSVKAETEPACSALKKLLKLPFDYFTYSESKRYEKYRIHQTSPETVRRCQLLAIFMLDELERICKKHSLRYYVAAGSLLGAVRHGEMIPWDDDVDVTMPRADYEKFIEIAQEELCDDVVMPKSNFPYGFARMMMKDTTIKRIVKQKGYHGVFMDVLPLDGAAPDEESAIKHEEEVKKILRRMRVRALPVPRLSFSKKSLTTLIYLMAIRCVPRSYYINKWRKIATRYSTEESDCWVCLPGSYGYEKERFPKEYWGEPVMMMYNGTMRPVMKEWKEYLTLHYGDYMRSPALLFRRTHESLSIDFGKYENMSIEELEIYLNNKRKEVADK